MNKENIKCILFDVDGVVINSEIFSIQYQKQYEISNAEMLPFFTGIFQECIVGKTDLKVTLKEWLPKWKWKGTVDEFLQFWFKAEHNIDERVIKVVKRLRKKGIKCCLATNQEKYRTQYMKKEMEFEINFDEIFSSYSIGYKKPDKAFYEAILNSLESRWNIQPREIMFFDDDQKNIDGANKLGIKGYFYKNFKEFKNIIDNK